jgi:hypothetical protein
MSNNLAEAQRFWNDDDALMDTLIGGLVSPPLSQKLAADILANAKSFGLEAYDPDGPPQYLGGRFGMHLRKSKEIYVDSWVRGVASDFKYLICEQCAYCANRQQMDGVNLAATIADALLSSAAAMPIPLTTIGVYLVKKGILDQLCGCNPPKPA